MEYTVYYKEAHLVSNAVKEVNADIVKAIRSEIAMHPFYGKVIRNNEVPRLVEEMLHVLEDQRINGSWFQFLNQLYWEIRGFRRFMKLDYPMAEVYHREFCDHLKALTDQFRKLQGGQHGIDYRVFTFTYTNWDLKDSPLKEIIEIYRASAYYDIEYTIMVNRFVKEALQAIHDADTDVRRDAALRSFPEKLRSIVNMAEAYPYTATGFLLASHEERVALLSVEISYAIGY